LEVTSAHKTVYARVTLQSQIIAVDPYRISQIHMSFI